MLSPRCFHDIPTLTLRAGPTGELRNHALSIGEAPAGEAGFVASLLSCRQTLLPAYTRDLLHGQLGHSWSLKGGNDPEKWCNPISQLWRGTTVMFAPKQQRPFLPLSREDTDDQCDGSASRCVRWQPVGSTCTQKPQHQTSRGQQLPGAVHAGTECGKCPMDHRPAAQCCRLYTGLWRVSIQLWRESPQGPANTRCSKLSSVHPHSISHGQAPTSVMRCTERPELGGTKRGPPGPCLGNQSTGTGHGTSYKIPRNTEQAWECAS